MDRKKIAFIVISVFVCLLVYLPTPKGVDPEQYNPGQFSSLDDLNIDKNKLNNAVFITTPSIGAQDVQIDKNGYIYSGLHDGSIIRIKPDNSETVVLGKSQGPIFGIDINKNGNKIVLADQLSGIKIFDIQTNTFQYLVSEYNGSKFVSPNGVVFGENDEIIYFTVSSQIIPMSQFHQMLLYSQGSGRIFGYNLRTKQLEVLANQLYFVNGIQYSDKENCLFFVQTSRSRLVKMDLQPEKRGNRTVILQNILGYPDNVKLSESGDLWVAIPALRDQFSNIVDHNSIIRRVILNLRMPLGLFIRVANMKYAGGIKVNPKNGQIIQYFFGNSKNIDCISGINEGNGKLYLSSLSKNKIAIVNIQRNSVKIESNKNQQNILNPPKLSTTKEIQESNVENVNVQQIKVDQKILKKQNIQNTLEKVIQKQVPIVKQESSSPSPNQENKIHSNQQQKQQKNIINQGLDKKQQLKTSKQTIQNQKIQRQPAKQSQQQKNSPKIQQSAQQKKIDSSQKSSPKTTTDPTKTNSTTKPKASQGSKVPNKTTQQSQNKPSNQGNSGNSRQSSGTQNNQGSTNTRNQGTQNKGYPNKGNGGKSQTNSYRSNEL